MVSTTLLVVLLTACAARAPAPRPLAELAPAPARAQPFQTEEEAWRAVLLQSGLPQPKTAPTVAFDDRVPEVGHLGHAVFAPRFLGGPDDARALMRRWTAAWAEGPVKLAGLSDEALVEGVSAWAVVGLAQTLALITATEGWTLRQDELHAELTLSADAGLYALDQLIHAGRVPPRWRTSYEALILALLAETSPSPLVDDLQAKNVGAEVRQTLTLTPILGMGTPSVSAEEQAALRAHRRALLERAAAHLAGPPPPLPEALTARLVSFDEASVERALTSFDPPLTSWQRSGEGVYVGALNDRGWLFRVDLDQGRVRAVLTAPVPKDPAVERDLMALANAVNGSLDSAHLDLMPGELRIRHAWTPLTSDTTAANDLQALVLIAERWAPLFEQVAAKALTVEDAWARGQGDDP